jgi:hypothetical protein
MSLLRHTLPALLACAPLLQAELVSLRQQWEAGKSYTLQTTTETLVKNTTDSRMTVVQTTELAASAESPRGTALKVTFVGSKAKITGQGQTAVFDSADQASSHPALVGSLGQSLGKSFTLVYDDKGRFKDLRDFSSLAVAPGAAPGLQAVEESKNVASLFRKSLEIGLPAVPVEVGSTWTADEVVTLASVGEVHADITGKLLRIEEKDGKRTATIGYDGTLRSTKAGSAKAPMAVDLAAGSSMSGTLIYDMGLRVVTEFNGTTQLGLNTGASTMSFELKETRRLLNVQPTTTK